MQCFLGIESYVALDRNPGPGYDTLLLILIPGGLLNACPHVQFHILPGFLDSQAALSTPTLTHACQAGRQSVPFYDGLATMRKSTMYDWCSNLKEIKSGC